MHLIALVTVAVLGATVAAGRADAAGAAQGVPPPGAPAPQMTAPAKDAPVFPSVKLPPDLARVLTDYEEAWSRRDAAALARLFAEDGWVLSRTTPPVRGRAAIQRHYTGQGGRLSLRALAFQTDGQVGFIIGAFTAVKGEADMGKFTLTLRKGADGRWSIMSDMDNSNR